MDTISFNEGIEFKTLCGAIELEYGNLRNSKKPEDLREIILPLLTPKYQRAMELGQKYGIDAVTLRRLSTLYASIADLWFAEKNNAEIEQHRTYLTRNG